MKLKTKVRVCLWFASGGLTAASEYVGLIPDSTIDRVLAHGRPESDPMVVEFTLAGAPMMILTAGDHYKLTPAASISVLTDDQEETDRLWAALTEGGEESQCGWLVDRHGVSWQIVPRRLPELLADPDPERAGRAMQAMMQMSKINIAALEAAAEANPRYSSTRP